MSNEINQSPHIAVLKALGVHKADQVAPVFFSPEEEWLASLGVCGFALENTFVQLFLEYRTRASQINHDKPIYNGRFPAIWFSADEEDVFNERVEVIIDAEVASSTVVLNKRDLILFAKDKDAFRLLMKPSVFEVAELIYQLNVAE